MIVNNEFELTWKEAAVA